MHQDSICRLVHVEAARLTVLAIQRRREAAKVACIRAPLLRHRYMHKDRHKASTGAGKAQAQVKAQASVR
jgi:Holliday junction resolvasome RuvABC endonuclease subunit